MSLSVWLGGDESHDDPTLVGEFLSILTVTPVSLRSSSSSSLSARSRCCIV